LATSSVPMSPLARAGCRRQPAGQAFGHLLRENARKQIGRPPGVHGTMIRSGLLGQDWPYRRSLVPAAEKPLRFVPRHSAVRVMRSRYPPQVDQCSIIAASREAANRMQASGRNRPTLTFRVFWILNVFDDVRT